MPNGDRDMAVGQKSEKRMGLIVEVRGNNIDKAIKILARKIKDEGIIKELRQRTFYEKPSVKRRRKHAEAVRRHATKIAKSTVV